MRKYGNGISQVREIKTIPFGYDALFEGLSWW